MDVSFVTVYKMAEPVAQQMRNCVCKTQTVITGTRPPLVASQYRLEWSNIGLGCFKISAVWYIGTNWPDQTKCSQTGLIYQFLAAKRWLDICIMYEYKSKNIVPKIFYILQFVNVILNACVGHKMKHYLYLRSKCVWVWARLAVLVAVYLAVTQEMVGKLLNRWVKANRK